MTKRKILTAGLIAAALTAAGCGSNDNNNAKVAGSGVDRAFVAEMIPHHQSAVEMAKIAQQRGSSPFVKTLADNIIRSQQTEISTMRAEDGQLAADGIKPGDLGVAQGAMGMSMDTNSLKTTTPFDQAFVAMMLPHHTGALVMAKAELAKGSDPELKQLARQIISAQQREIAQMRDFQASAQ